MLNTQIDLTDHNARSNKPKQTALESTMTASIETVTPKQALMWIEHNLKNRNIREHLVSKLAHDMEEGKFEENGESIKFDISGNLCDGQHRLKAIIRSGVTIRTVVVRGLHPRAFQTIDTGSPKNAGDFLRAAGYKSPACLSAAARIVYQNERDDRPGLRILHGVAPSVTDILETAVSHPGLPESAHQFSVGHKNTKYLVPPSVTAVVHYYCNQKDEELCAWFFDKLETGEGLSFGMPVFTLRNRLMKVGRDNTYEVRQLKMTMLIKAWNCTRANTQLKNMVVTLSSSGKLDVE